MDELQVLSKDKEKFSTAIPAIWPIDRSKMRNKIGAFGYRMHPVYRRWKFHSGVDMPGRVGDPIYATGDGVVESTIYSRARTGYGTQVVVNHGLDIKHAMHTSIRYTFSEVTASSAVSSLPIWVIREFRHRLTCITRCCIVTRTSTRLTTSIRICRPRHTRAL